MSKFAVVSATSRSVVFVCEAATKEAAISAAVTGLDRSRAPASWDAWQVSELPSDLQVDAEKWRPDAEVV